MVAQAFNPSTRQMETGSDMAGQRETVRWEEKELRIQSEDSWRQDLAPLGLGFGRGKN